MGLLPKADVDIFPASQETADTFKQASQDWRLGRLGVSIIDGGIESAARRYVEYASPSLVVIELSAKDQDILALIEKLAQCCDPGTRAIVIGHTNDVNLYRELTALGVSDYLVPPLTTDLVVDAFQRALGGADAALDHKLVAVVSGKGGVGVTSVAQQISWLLADRVKDQALLLDLCGASGTAGIALGVQSKRSIDGLLTDLDQLDPDMIRSTAVEVRPRLSVLSGGEGTLPADLFASGAVEKLLDVALATEPLVIADLPTGWGSLARDISLRADAIIVVTEPTLPSLRNTRMLLDDLKSRRSDPPVQLVVNRSGLYGKAEVSDADIEKSLGVKPAVLLPFDPVAFASIEMDGESFGKNKNAAKLLKTLENVAFAVAGAVKEKPKEKKRWKFMGF